MNQIPSIVSGNDFVLNFYVYSPSYVDGNTIMTEFDLTDCEDIEIKLIHSKHIYIAKYTLDESDANLIKIDIDSKLAVGSYAIEITGKTSDGKNWRYKGKQGECFNIVDATSAAQYTTEGETCINCVIGFYGTDMNNYYTKAEIDDFLSNPLDTSYYALKSELFSGDYNDLTNKPSFSDYATKNYVNSKVNNTSSLIMQQIATKANSSDVYTKSEVNNLIASNPGSGTSTPVDLSAYVTKEDLNTASYLTSSDLDNYALKSELFSGDYNDLINKPISTGGAGIDLSAYVTKEDLNTASYVSSVHLDEYATITYVQQNYVLQSQAFSGDYNDLINKPTFTGGSEVDLSDYVSKSDLSTAGYLTSNDLSNYVTQFDLSVASYITFGDLDDYATESYVMNQGFVTQSDLSDYALKSELFSGDYNDLINKPSFSGGSEVDLSDYVSKSDLSTLGYLTSGDLSNYVTQFDLSVAGYITHNDLDGYATESYVMNQGFVTQSDLFDYPQRSELFSGDYNDLINKPDIPTMPNMSDYVTQFDLSNAGYLTSNDLSNYVTQFDLSVASYLTPSDLDGYATESYVMNQGFVTQSDLVDYPQRSELFSGDYNDLINKPDIPTIPNMSDYVTQYDLSTAGYLTSNNLSNYVTQFDLSVASYLTHNDLDGYATESYVMNQGFVTQSDLVDYPQRSELFSGDYNDLVNKPNMSDYVSKIDLSNASYLTQGDLNGYATESYVMNQGFLTQQSLDNYVTKSDIDSQSYVTSNDLNSMSYITSQDLSNYVTKTDLSNASYLTSIPNTVVTSTTQGLKIEIVASMPADPDANTIYIVQ